MKSELHTAGRKMKDGAATASPSLPSPDQLPVSAQSALADLLAATRRPFTPSIAQLATEYLTLFIELRAMGARWPQIADFLFDQGFSGPTGKITGNVWRATVSRALRSQPSRPAHAVTEATPVEAPKSTEASRPEASRPVAVQSGAERNGPSRTASERDGTERNATRRNAPRTTVAQRTGTERSVPQQSETQRDESRKSAAKHNEREPPATAPARMPPELRADSELARRAALIDKPFKTR